MTTLNATRDMATFNQSFAIGLAAEKQIKMFLISKGFKVTNSSKDENKFQDIDCWIGSTPASIKCQHTALKYPNRSIYFETRQKLTGTDTWEDSWFYYSKAEKYLIMQGTELILLDKQAILDHVEVNGWNFVRTLGWRRKASVGGSYRYDDAECGFLAYDTVPKEIVWVID